MNDSISFLPLLFFFKIKSMQVSLKCCPVTYKQNRISFYIPVNLKDKGLCTLFF